MTRTLRTWVPLLLGIALVMGTIAYGPSLAQRVAYAVTRGSQQAYRDELKELSKQDHMSPLFRAVAQAVQPAVVEVRVTKKVAGMDGMPFGPDLDDFMRRFGMPELPPSQLPKRIPIPPRGPREFVERGLGSGVIVDAAKGYVLTNSHVVRGADEVEVVLSDGRKFDTEWVRSDPATDLAIVKIKPDGLIDAPLGDSDRIQIGDWVLAFGSPRGLSQTVTAGIISAMGRTTHTPNTYQDFIQTDAAINQGNSGGPLVNMQGEVVGINTAIISATGGNDGIGFAVPSNMARTIMTQLIEKGKVVRGYLGVGIQDVDKELAASFHLPDTNGALVTKVLEDTPAAKAGLAEGDFIVAVNGRKVRDVNELRNAAAAIAPGTTVTVEFYRNGEKQMRQLTLGTRPEELDTMVEGGPPAPQRDVLADRYGLRVDNVTDEAARQFGYRETPRGVLIVEVAPSSDAAEKGVRAGMVIKKAQGQEVSTVAQLAKVVADKKAEEGLQLLLGAPGGGQIFVFLTPRK